MNVGASEVQSCLHAGQLVPVFQPLVRLRTGELAGFEILARWQHPEKGLILPANFIQVAEETGQIGLLTEHVLRGAFVAARQLPDVPFFSVNVSPCQLRDNDLPSLFARLGDETGYPLNKLTVEITESALVDNLEQARAVVGQLRELGCRLSLDDFGTGYSSLHHLRSLPFDELKIDRSFVSSMGAKRESRKIVAAVAGLGKSLGLTIVAEGIETEENAEMLSWLGCEVGQGWLFGKPLPATSLPEQMAAIYFAPSGQVMAPGRSTTDFTLEAMPEQRLALLQAIYDGTPSYLCVLDRELRYVSLNRRMAELNSRPVEAHLGRKVSEILPLLYPKIERYLLSALRGQAISDVEVFRRGTERGQRDKTLLGSYQPMFDEAGEVTGVLIALVDITGRKRAESALRRSVAQSRLLDMFPVRAASRGTFSAL
jgi:PAS domain S-box-containing protein